MLIGAVLITPVACPADEFLQNAHLFLQFPLVLTESNANCQSCCKSQLNLMPAATKSCTAFP